MTAEEKKEVLGLARIRSYYLCINTLHMDEGHHIDGEAPRFTKGIIYPCRRRNNGGASIYLTNNQGRNHTINNNDLTWFNSFVEVEVEIS